MNPSPSYDSDACCGCDCDYYPASEPCWGKVSVIDERWSPEGGVYEWVHVCEGHESVYNGGEYVHETV